MVAELGHHFVWVAAPTAAMGQLPWGSNCCPCCMGVAAYAWTTQTLCIHINLDMEMCRLQKYK